MLNRIAEQSRLGIVLLVCLVMCIGCAIPIFIFQECNQQNEIPSIEVYPNSQLVNQALHDFGVQRMVNLTYGVDASQQEVLAYFSEDLVCTSDSTGTRSTCRGHLPNDDIEYFAYLTPTTSQEFTYSYIVEIHWTGCSWNFQMTE